MPRRGGGPYMLRRGGGPSFVRLGSLGRPLRRLQVERGHANRRKVLRHGPRFLHYPHLLADPRHVAPDVRALRGPPGSSGTRCVRKVERFHLKGRTVSLDR